MDSVPVVFAVMIFVAVLLLTQGLLVPAGDRRAAKRVRKRMQEVANLYQDSAGVSLLREKYHQSLSPSDRLVESLPGGSALREMIEQSGSAMTVRRLLMLCATMAALAFLGTWLTTHNHLAGMAAGLVVGYLPILRIQMQRGKRLSRFEEQLPDALDIMIRALRAGHPFNETLKVVSEEMDEPIAKEFDLTFADINYGMDLRAAFLNLLQRVPSTSLLSLVTAILIQRETGGNLTEILDKIAAVIRGRFHFQRRVRAISAQARMSAWILVLLPFVVFAAISITTPTYLPMLLNKPLGQKIAVGGFVAMIAGILWIRRMVGKVMEI